MKHLVYRWYGELRSAPITQELQHSYLLTGNRMMRKTDGGVVTVVEDAERAKRLIKLIEPYDTQYSEAQRAADEQCRNACAAARNVRDAATRLILMENGCD